MSTTEPPEHDRGIAAGQPRATAAPWPVAVVGVEEGGAESRFVVRAMERHIRQARAASGRLHVLVDDGWWFGAEDQPTGSLTWAAPGTPDRAGPGQVLITTVPYGWWRSVTTSSGMTPVRSIAWRNNAAALAVSRCSRSGMSTTTPSSSIAR
jgi:hypothetical protein